MREEEKEVRVAVQDVEMEVEEAGGITELKDSQGENKWKKIK
jgi:hypothetical protein